MYCNQKYRKALDKNKLIKPIYTAFSELEQEIKTLTAFQQLRLYSASTQLLESLSEQPKNSINPLDVFIHQCDSIVGSKKQSSRAIALGLGVIAIGLSVTLIGMSIGIGIGVLSGLWQSYMAFFSALSATKTAPLVVVGVNGGLGISAGACSQLFFFKEQKINKVIDNCVDAIKSIDLSLAQDCSMPVKTMSLVR